MILQTVWFFLWGLLWAGFFMTDGFDFGIGILYPFLGKTEQDKRTMIHAIGPVWDANEVWLITAGGVTFAAFPLFYSIMFSALYSPLMIILFALIFRGISFEFRGKIKNIIWKKIWDLAIFVGSFVPTFLFGIIFANIFQGLPIDQNGVYSGNFINLFNPYGLLGGVLFLSLFIMHGALWLNLRSSGSLQIRTNEIAIKIWPILSVCVFIFLVSTAVFTDLYYNYINYPILLIIILIISAFVIAIRYFLGKKLYMKAWLSSAGTIIGCMLFSITGLFPVLFKSSIHEMYNITAFNSSSSPLTLKIMLVVTIIFIPIVISYQIWSYNLFRGKVTNIDLADKNMY